MIIKILTGWSPKNQIQSTRRVFNYYLMHQLWNEGLYPSMAFIKLRNNIWMIKMFTFILPQKKRHHITWSTMILSKVPIRILWEGAIMDTISVKTIFPYKAVHIFIYRQN